MNLLDDFLSLFFPKTCLACGNSLYGNEEIICLKCILHLPETNFHREEKNPVGQVFLGRVPVELASAYFYYKKGGVVQKLIHQLKYRGHAEIGNYLGKIYGSKLIENPAYKDIDSIIPIPLHEKKQKKRGFNQAEKFAQGLSESMNIAVNTKIVSRVKATSTQTKKSRYNRWENVENMFEVAEPALHQGKHFLLVDDVITTGATMEACLQALQIIPGVKLSVSAIAFAHH
jgi:ComF family protein